MARYHHLFCIQNALLALLLCQTAHAQFDGPYPNFAPDNMNAIMSSHINGLTLENLTNSKTGGRSKTTKSKGTSGVKSQGSRVKVGSTSYTSSPAVTTKVKKQFLAWARTQSPEQAAQLEVVFNKYNPIQVWSGIVKEDGLRTGDVADSLAAYWILNYLIATQRQDSTRTQALAVRNQIRTLLAGNPAFTRLTSAQRQEMAEVWMLNFVVQQGAYGTAMKGGDKEMIRKLSAAAVARFQNEMHLDLRQLRLTNDGFTSRA